MDDCNFIRLNGYFLVISTAKRPTLIKQRCVKSQGITGVDLSKILGGKPAFWEQRVVKLLMHVHFSIIGVRARATLKVYVYARNNHNINN